MARFQSGCWALRTPGNGATPTGRIGAEGFASSVGLVDRRAAIRRRSSNFQVRFYLGEGQLQPSLSSELFSFPSLTLGARTSAACRAAHASVPGRGARCATAAGSPTTTPPGNTPDTPATPN